MALEAAGTWSTVTALGGPVDVPSVTYVDVPGGRAAVRDTAPGDAARPVVVLVHGWCADSLTNWHQTFAPLHRAGWRVVAPDLPGFGATELHGRWTMELAAVTVLQVLETLGVDRPVWCGYSLGGPVTQTALRLGAGMSGVVQVATAAHIVPSRVDRTFLYGLERSWFMASTAMGTLRRLAGGANTHGPADSSTLAGHARHLLARTDKRAVAQAGAALARFDSRPWLSTLALPPAVSVVTTSDRTVPTSAQRELAQISGAETVDLPGDHRVCLQPSLGQAVDVALQMLRHRGPGPAGPPTT